MMDGPDISIPAAMIGDPARSNMLLALMSELSLTAAELAREAGVTPSTASGHLSKLEDAGLWSDACWTLLEKRSVCPRGRWGTRKWDT